MVISFIPSIILNIVYHPIARKSSWKGLPKIAEKLGLNYNQSKLFSGFGEISGVIKDHNIIIKPDENAKIVVFCNSAKPLLLWTEKSLERPNSKMTEFRTHNWIFNTIFKTRRTSQIFGQVITDSTNLIDSFIQFYMDWIWNLKSIYVSDNAIYCEFKYGHPFFPYIPATVVGKIINDMVSLAEQIDSAQL